MADSDIDEIIRRMRNLVAANAPAAPSVAPWTPASLPAMLWQNRDDMELAQGGDTTLVNETMGGLRELGVKVSLSLEERPALDGFGAVTLVNISRTRDTLAQLANAKARGKPTVLIPLYEDMDRYLVPAMKTDLLFRYLAIKGKQLPLDALKLVRDGFELSEHPLENPFARQFGIGDADKQRSILGDVDYILTSGKAESDSIRKKFAPKAPMEEMFYGFNRDFSSADPRAFVSRHGLKDFVLCVGRLEPRKNQWQLIEVFRSLPHLTLVLIGVFSDPSMEPLIKAYAPPNVRFFSRLPFAELVSAYAAARVHVLPSWYELPGLVSLEAAAAGCRIVSTDWGTAPDYLGDKVAYCSPDHPAGIREAVLKAYDTDATASLREYVLENFSWKRAARKCMDVYERLSRN